MVSCASKNRSEGEKVRVSDDIILSSVSSERYLHLAPLSNTEKERIRRLVDDWLISDLVPKKIRKSEFWKNFVNMFFSVKN